METAIRESEANDPVLVEAIARAGLSEFQDYLVRRRKEEVAKIAEGRNDGLSSEPSVDLLLRYIINGLYTCAHDVIKRFDYPKEISS